MPRPLPEVISLTDLTVIQARMLINMGQSQNAFLAGEADLMVELHHTLDALADAFPEEAKKLGLKLEMLHKLVGCGNNCKHKET